MRTVLPLTLCTLLGTVVLLPLIVPESFRADMEEAWFEGVGGRTVLITGHPPQREIVPTINLYRSRGELGLPPGFAVALPLEPGDGYVVRTVSAHLLPYFVLGSEQPLPSGTSLDGGRAGASTAGLRFIDAVRAPLAEGDRVGWTPWAADAPLKADRERLSTLAAVCGVDKGAPSARIERAADGVHVTLGRCSSVAPAPAGKAVLGLVSGVDSVAVERADGRVWPTTREWSGPSVAFLVAIVLLHALVLVFGLGPGAAVSLVVTLAVARVWFPYETTLLWIACGLAGLLAASVRLWWRAGGLTRGIAVAAVVVAVALVSQRSPAAAPRPAESPHECVLTGYSTAMDGGIEFGTAGILTDLATVCPRCQSKTGRVARGAEDFAFIRDSVCAADFPAGSGADVFFIGGTNDDLFWLLKPSWTLAWIKHLLPAGRVAFDHASLGTSHSTLDMGAGVNGFVQDVGAEREPQMATLRGALDCSRQRGIRFRFFHDFFLGDAWEGRSPEREAMVGQRRKAVEEAGMTFVDLLPTVRDQVGVSWFADHIHPSTLGHRRVAELMCAAASVRAP